MFSSFFQKVFLLKEGEFLPWFITRAFRFKACLSQHLRCLQPLSPQVKRLGYFLPFRLGKIGMKKEVGRMEEVVSDEEQLRFCGHLAQTFLNAENSEYFQLSVWSSTIESYHSCKGRKQSRLNPAHLHTVIPTSISKCLVTSGRALTEATLLPMSNL